MTAPHLMFLSKVGFTGYVLFLLNPVYFGLFGPRNIEAFYEADNIPLCLNIFR